MIENKLQKEDIESMQMFFVANIFQYYYYQIYLQLFSHKHKHTVCFTEPFLLYNISFICIKFSAHFVKTKKLKILKTKNFEYKFCEKL